MPKSRSTRNELDSFGVCCGKKNNASISKIIVTTSTVSCVSAKSGAEKRVNTTDTINPTIESINNDTIRERCQITVASAPIINKPAPIALCTSTGVSGMLPASCCISNNGQPAHSSTTANIITR